MAISHRAVFWVKVQTPGMVQVHGWVVVTCFRRLSVAPGVRNNEKADRV